MVTKTATQWVDNRFVEEKGTVRRSKFFSVGGVAVELEKFEKFVKLSCGCDYSRDGNICTHKAAVMIYLSGKVRKKK